MTHAKVIWQSNKKNMSGRGESYISHIYSNIKLNQAEMYIKKYYECRPSFYFFLSSKTEIKLLHSMAAAILKNYFQ